MKVYLLYRVIDVLPEVVGVYTNRDIAEIHMFDDIDYIVETLTDIEPDELLPYPETREGY